MKERKKQELFPFSINIKETTDQVKTYKKLMKFWKKQNSNRTKRYR